jgi:hypothetical protein
MPCSKVKWDVDFPNHYPPQIYIVGLSTLLQENVALIYTQRRLIIMFVLLNSLHCIDFLQGSPLSHGLHKNELLLKRAQGSNDQIRFAIASQITRLGHPSQMAFHT